VCRGESNRDEGQVKKLANSFVDSQGRQWGRGARNRGLIDRSGVRTRSGEGNLVWEGSCSVRGVADEFRDTELGKKRKYLINGRFAPPSKGEPANGPKIPEGGELGATMANPCDKSSPMGKLVGHVGKVSVAVM